jgi:hypothetical protein
MRRLRREIDRLLLGPISGRIVPPPSLSAQPYALSVVVLSVGAPVELRAAVQSLYSQSVVPEVVVVNTGGGDAAHVLAEVGLAPPVISCRQRLMPGAARNIGVAASHAPYVAFLASDCVAEPGWIAHRLAHHVSGVDVVASAVTNAFAGDAAAEASHMLLFATRLPGTPPPSRKFYGASYARSVFERFGRFRDDLRTGEDTDLHARFDASVRLVYESNVRTAHANPRTAIALLRDQFVRGRRTTHAHRTLGSGLNGRAVARVALARVPTLVALSFRAAPAPRWPALARGLPWIVPAALAYAVGASTASRAPDVRVDAARARRSREKTSHRLVCVVQARNEARFVDGFLANVAPSVDAIIALDDGSTDGGFDPIATHPSVVEALQIAPRSPHVWDELRNKRILIDAAHRHCAKFVLALDVDERLERGFRERADVALDTADRDGIDAYAILIRELWDRHDQVRVDGVWGRKWNPRLFRLRVDHDFGDRALHGGWAPENSRSASGGYPPVDLRVYHLRMIHAEDRARRVRRYKRLDPESRWQTIGYDYLENDEGIELETISADRAYVPFEMPPPPGEPEET